MASFSAELCVFHEMQLHLWHVALSTNNSQLPASLLWNPPRRFAAVPPPKLYVCGHPCKPWQQHHQGTTRQRGALKLHPGVTPRGAGLERGRLAAAQ